MRYNQEIGQSIETDLEMVQVLDLADKDIKASIVNTFKKLKENLFR